jgi:heptosyltransferase III
MRILFVTATRIGDAVLSTGLLSHLIERYPAARITIAAGPLAAQIFASAPQLERLLVVEKRKYALHWAGLYAAVAARRWDMAVDLRGSALAYFLIARERHSIAKSDYGEHRVRQLARIFALDPPPAPRLWLGAPHERQAAELVPAGAPVLALAPAANWRGKEWRAERFSELARRLTASDGLLANARIMILAAAHERAQAEPVLASLPPARRIDLVGKVDLLTAGAALKRCALFIGNDSGLMHLAAAAGIPTLGLFGPTAASRYAPWGPLSAIATTTQKPATMFGPGFDHRTTDTLMDTLSVDAAESAARDLWERVVSAAA